MMWMKAGWNKGWNRGWKKEMTYAKVYAKGVLTLEQAGIVEAELDARLLLEHVCHTTRQDLLAHGEREVEEADRSCYEELLQKRASHVPLQYLTGVQEFMGLEFDVSEDVLVPRQDTEVLVEEVMRFLHDGMRILDVCTGSGCILLSLLHYSNDCEGIGLDISEKALAVAAQNAEKLGLLAEAGRAGARFGQGDLFEGLQNRKGCRTDGKSLSEAEAGAATAVPGTKFDIIVSNPPYIRSDVIPTLMEEVRKHEPVGALDGGEDGLIFYRRIIEEAPQHLNGGGMLFFEIGYDQAEAVSMLMKEAEFQDVRVLQDFAGHDRVVYGMRTLG